jgi:hypothetical protein
MATKAKAPKLSQEERDRIIRLKRKYDNRITLAKHGKELLDAGDFGGSLRKFLDYLNILAEVNNVKEIYELKTSMFDPKKDLTEMMMMSHIFFEMARLYDAVPKFQEDAQKCLDQFVHFSANQPFQVLNSEMVRKNIKKSIFKNPLIFKNAHQQIFVQSKKCYIVTYCYGDQHPMTQDFRLFKDWLLEFRLGLEMVRLYYQFSSRIVIIFGERPFFKYANSVFVKPLLILFSKTILPVIIKKC